MMPPPLRLSERSKHLMSDASEEDIDGSPLGPRYNAYPTPVSARPEAAPTSPSPSPRVPPSTSNTSTTSFPRPLNRRLRDRASISTLPITPSASDQPSGFGFAPIPSAGHGPDPSGDSAPDGDGEKNQDPGNKRRRISSAEEQGGDEVRTLAADRLKLLRSERERTAKLEGALAEERAQRQRREVQIEEKQRKETEERSELERQLSLSRRTCECDDTSRRKPVARSAVLAAAQAAALDRDPHQCLDRNAAVKALEEATARANIAEARAKEAEERADGLAAETRRWGAERDDCHTRLASLTAENITYLQEKEDGDKGTERLQTMMSNLSKENDSLVQRLTETTRLYESNTAQLQSVEQQLANSQRDLSASQRSEDSLRAGKRTLSDRLDRAVERADGAERRASGLETSQDQLERKNMQMSKQLEEGDTRVVEMRKKHMDLLVAKSGVERELATVRADAQRAKEEVRELKEQNAAQRRELEKAKADVQAHETETAALVEELTGVREEEAAVLLDAQQRLAESVAREQAQSSALSTLQAETSQLRADRDDLASQLDVTHRANLAHEATIARLEESASARDGDKEDSDMELDADIEALSHRQAPRKAAAKDSPLSTHVLNLTQKLKAQKAELDGFTASRTAEISRILKQHESARTKLEADHALALSNYERAFAELGQTLAERAVKIADLESQLSDARENSATISRLTAEKDRLANRVAQLGDDILYTATPADDLTRQLNDLRGKLKAADGKLKEAHFNRDRYKVERDKLRIDMDKVRREKQRNPKLEKDDGKELVRIHKTMEAQTAEISAKQEEIQQLQSEISLLRDTAAESAQRIQSLDVLVQSNSLAMATAEREKAAAAGRAAELQSEAERSAGEEQQLKARWEDAKAEVERLTNLVQGESSLHKTIESLRSDNARLQSELDGAATQYNSRMDESRAESADQIYALSETIDQHESALDQLRSELATAVKRAELAADNLVQVKSTDALQQEVDRLAAEEIRLSSVIDGMRAAAELLSGDMASTKLELEEVVEEAEAAKATAAAELVQKQASIDHLASEIARLTADADEAAKRGVLQRLSQKLERDALSANVASLTERIGQYESATTTQSAEADAQHEIDRLTEERKGMASRIEELEVGAGKLKEELERVKGEQSRSAKESASTISGLKVRLGDQQTEMKKLQAVIDAGKSDVARIQAELDQRKSDHLNSLADKTRLSAELAVLRQRVDDRDRELAWRQSSFDESEEKARKALGEADRLSGTCARLELRAEDDRKQTASLTIERDVLRGEKAKLEEEVARSNTAYSTLQQAAAVLSAENSRQHLLIDASEKAAAQLRQQADAAETQCTQLISDNFAFSQKVNTLTSRISEHERDLRDALRGSRREEREGEVMSLPDFVKELRQRLANQGGEIRRLTEEKARVEGELANAQSQLSTYRQADEARAAETSQQESLVASLHSDVARLQAEVNSARSERDKLSSEAASAAKAVGSRIAELEGELRHAVEFSQKMETAMKEVEGEVERVERENAGLAKDAEGLRQQVQDLSNKAVKGAEEKQRLEGVIASSESRISAYQQAANERDVELAERQTLVDSLKSEVDLLQAALANVESERDGLITKKGNLLREIKALETRVEQHERALADATKRVEAADAATRSAQAEKRRVESGRLGLVKNAEEVRQEMERMGAEMVDMKAARERMETQVADLESTISTHQQAVDAHLATQALQQTQITNLEADATRLRSELETALQIEAERDDLRAQRDVLAEHLKQNAEGDKAEIAALEQQVRQKEKEKEDLADEVKAAERRVEGVEAERLDLIASAQGHQAAAKALEIELENVKAEKEDALGKAKTAAAAVKSLTGDVNASQAVVTSLRSDVARLQTELDRAAQSRQALQDEKASLANEIQSLSNTILVREADLTAARQSLAKSESHLQNTRREMARQDMVLVGLRNDGEKLRKEVEVAKATATIAREAQEAADKLLAERLAKVEDLEAKVKVLTAAQALAVIIHKREISHKQGAIVELEKEKAKVGGQAGELAKKVLRQTQAILELREASRLANETISVRDATIREQGLKLSEAQTAADALRETIAGATATASAARKEADDLASEKAGLVAQIAKLGERFASVSATLLSHRFNADAEALRSSTKQSQIDALSKDLDEANAKAETARKEVEVSRAELQNLRAEGKAERESSSAKQFEVERLSKALLEEEARAKEAREKAEAVEGERQALSREIRELRMSLAIPRPGSAPPSTSTPFRSKAAAQQAMDALQAQVSDLRNALAQRDADLAARLGSSNAQGSAGPSEAVGQHDELQRLQAEMAEATSTISNQKAALDAIALKELGRDINVETLQEQVATLRAQLAAAENDTQAAFQSQRNTSSDHEAEILRLGACAEELELAKSKLEEEARELRLKARRKFTAARLCALLSGDGADDEPEDPEWTYGDDPWMDEVVAKFKEMAGQAQEAISEKDQLLQVALELETENTSLKENLERLDVFLSANFPNYAQSAAQPSPAGATQSHSTTSAHIAPEPAMLEA